MPQKILQAENSILRKKSKELKESEIQTPKTKKIISEMQKAMHGELDSVAIAAPQIGYNLRIFIVSGRIFEIESEINNKKKEKTDKKVDDMIFINPKIIKLSKKTHWIPEGCLSIRWKYGEVKRSTNVTIEAYNEKGEKIKRGAGGLLSQVFQHETDHLDGILFTDKARNIENMSQEEIDAYHKEIKKKNEKS